MLVSVAVTTYNHEKYIAQCLDGILMQKINFPLEIVLCEDCSQDNTLAICKEYASKHKNIRLIVNNPNQGYHKNFLQVLKECSGEYVALCEGDDFWIDENKLQKQIDFLSVNQEYSMCTHGRDVLIEEKNAILSPSQTEFTMEGGNFDNEFNLLNEWVTHTCAIVYRRSCLDINSLEQYAHFYDVHVYYHLLKVAPGYYMPNMVASVYRKHDSFHNGRDWTYLAKVALKNDAELYRYNHEDEVARKLLDKTLKLYENSIEYRIRKTKSIDGLMWNDIRLYLYSKTEIREHCSSLITICKWIKVLLKVKLK